ncbi:hypothetical protein, partial [Nostoc sp. DedVER01b]|uniref:hypothetical protein n=1 Tax=Nostoc sp. DedVER01b TaxID=3075404 RepID=UPI002AD2BFEB
IPILYEDALNHIEVQEIRKRNEPQRTQRTQRKKLKGFGAASQRNGITLKNSLNPSSVIWKIHDVPTVRNRSLFIR